MKNKLYLIIAICAMSFSSCNKSTSPIEPDPTPSTDSEKTIEFILPATTEHKAFYEQKFEFDLNGTKISFKESDMKEMTTEADLARIPILTSSTERAISFIYGTDHTLTAQFYKYTLGKLKKGETVSAVSRKPIIKSDRPSVEDYNCLIGYELLIDGKEGDISNVNYHKGRPNTDEAITQFFNALEKDFQKLTYSYK